MKVTELFRKAEWRARVVCAIREPIEERAMKKEKQVGV